MSAVEEEIRKLVEARFGAVDRAPPSPEPEPVEPVDEAIGNARRVVLGDPEVLSENAGEMIVGLTRLLGIPGDAVNGILKHFGADPVFAGAKGLQAAASDLGLAPRPGDESQTLGGRVLQNVGTQAVPFGAALGAGRALAGVPTAAMRVPGPAEMAQTVARNPRMSAAVEGGAAVGAAAGGVVAERVAPQSPSARAVGELLGSVAGASPAGSLIQGNNLAGNVVTRRLPFTDAGAFQRAGRRVRSLTDDPTGDARRIGAAELGESPAQATGEPRLMALERRLMEGDPAAERRITRLNKVAADTARKAALAGDAGGAERFIQMLAEEAGGRAQRALKRLPQGVSTRDASIQTRAIIESVAKRAEAVAGKLYDRVDGTLAVAPNKARESLGAELLGRSVSDDPKDIPRWVRDLIGDIQPAEGVPGQMQFVPGRIRSAVIDENGNVTSPSTETVGDIRRLRSRLLAESSNERAKLSSGKGNRNKIRIMSRLADDLLEDLEAVDDGALAAANSFNRRMNDRFRRGAVGELRGFEATREASVRPAETLEVAFRGGGGETGGEVVRELLRASPKIQPRLESFVLNQFRLAALDPRSGRIDRKALDRFRQRNASTIEALPGLKQKLDTASSAQKAVDDLVGGIREDGVSPLRREKASVALWLDAPFEQEMTHALTQSKNPGVAMRELMSQVRRDPTGTAMRGFKTSFVDSLIRRSTRPRANPHGAGTDKVTTGATLRSLVDENKAAVSAVLNPAERKRLETVVSFFERADLQRETSPDIGSGLINDLPGRFADLLARIAGARGGAKAGGAAGGSQLVLAGAFSRAARATLKSINNDSAREFIAAAVEDPKKMQALLTGSDSIPGRQGQAARILQTFLAVPISSNLNKGQREKTTEEQIVEILREISNGLPDAPSP